VKEKKYDVFGFFFGTRSVFGGGGSSFQEMLRDKKGDRVSGPLGVGDRGKGDDVIPEISFRRKDSVSRVHVELSAIRFL